MSKKSKTFKRRSSKVVTNTYQTHTFSFDNGVMVKFDMLNEVVNSFNFSRKTPDGRIDLYLFESNDVEEALKMIKVVHEFPKYTFDELEEWVASFNHWDRLFSSTHIDGFLWGATGDYPINRPLLMDSGCCCIYYKIGKSSHDLDKLESQVGKSRHVREVVDFSMNPTPYYNKDILGDIEITMTVQLTDGFFKKLYDELKSNKYFSIKKLGEHIALNDLFKIDRFRKLTRKAQDERECC